MLSTICRARNSAGYPDSAESVVLVHLVVSFHVPVALERALTDDPLFGTMLDHDYLHEQNCGSTVGPTIYPLLHSYLS